MNSAPLLDLAAAPALPQNGEAAGPTAKTDVPTEEFSLLLDEQTEDPAPPALSTEEETKTDEIPWLLAPLVLVCPLPDLQIPVDAETAEAVVLPEVKLEPISLPAAQLAAEDAPENPDLVEAVTPAPIEKKEKMEGVDLDPKIFEAIAEEKPELKPLKPLELSRPLPLSRDDGMVVAQQAKEVKNNGKSAEVAPAIEQKMPVREIFRRILPESSRHESFQVPIEYSTSNTAEFHSEAPTTVAPAKSLDAAHVIEMIRTEVTQLRHRGDATVSLVLRAENSAPLQVEVSVARDGSIRARASCEAGDFNSLSAQWPQLQQSLAAHGIRMTDLSSQNHFNQQSPSQSSQNFERGQNQHRQQPDAPTFEEELAGSAPRFAPQKQTFQSTPAPTRRWQSWA